jgi:hypothetical protein
VSLAFDETAVESLARLISGWVVAGLAQAA